MKKNVYMSPEVEVVELKHTTALLSSSPIPEGSGSTTPSTDDTEDL